MKILVIDDDSTFLDKMKKLLKLDQHIVSTAISGEKSLEILNNNQFDLILMDLKMPGLSGGPLIQRIREISVNSIIIVITGYGTIDTAVETIKAGAYDYMSKPFDISKFRKKIEDIESALKLGDKLKIFEGSKESESEASLKKASDNTDLYYLLCLLKGNGITIFHHSFLDYIVEGSLVGGFISAIDSFQSLLKQWFERGREGPLKNSLESGSTNRREWEIKYQKFKIFVFEMDYLNFVLILSNSPSQALKNSLEAFGSEVEKKFGVQLKNYNGHIDQFQPIQLLVQKYFAL